MYKYSPLRLNTHIIQTMYNVHTYVYEYKYRVQIPLNWIESVLKQFSKWYDTNTIVRYDTIWMQGYIDYKTILFAIVQKVSEF